MLAQTLLPEFDHEMATTRKVLEHLPAGDLAWKPHEKSYSVGDLATHIANIPTWVGVTLETDALDVAGGFEPPPTGDRDALLGIFDRNAKAAREKLSAADDATLTSSWALKAGDVEHLRMPKVAVLRAFVLSHMIHHRGQMTVYLRLLGQPVPSVYGPSADEPTF